MSTSRGAVLARGLGSRMRAADPGATLSPDQVRAADAGVKAMMPLNGRPFLDYILSALADAGVTTVALVVAPDHRHLLRRYTQDAPPSRVELTFVVQQQALGTADAVLAAEEWTGKDPFLTVNADNLYPGGALRDLAALDEPGLPGFQAADLVRSGNISAERIGAFASIRTDEEGYLSSIVEKPDARASGVAGVPDTHLISMNCWRFDARIFAACRDVARSPRGEFELPEAVALAVRRGVRFKVVPASGAVLDLSRRGDAADLERRLRGIAPRP